MSYIKVSNLQKQYKIYDGHGFKRKKKTIDALKNVNLEVNRGDFIGYIGPNGAGKSTTIKILTGIMIPDSGDVQIGEFCPWKDRKKYVKNIGVVFGQKTQLWWDLPVIDTYNLLKGIFKVDDIIFKTQLEYLTKWLDLEEILHHPVRQLSLGQRMRAELGACLIHDPEILFLDEPTIGLDIISKHKVLDFLKELNARGKTIFLTTHDVLDLEKLCSEILVLNHGQIMYKGDIPSLKSLSKDNDLENIVKKYTKMQYNI